MIRQFVQRLSVRKAVAVACGGAIAAALPLTATAQAGGSLPGTNIARVVIGSAIVIGLLFLTVRLIPRLGSSRSVDPAAFRVVATLPIGQRERVVVVQVGQQQILLGVAPGQVRRLHELEAPLTERASAVSGHAAGPPPLWLERITGRRA